MGDIDFDELDKAVNQVLGTAPVPQRPKNTTPQTESSDTTLAESHPQERVSSSHESLRSVEQRSEASVPPLSPGARRATGRFMDVVHPSSDMRQTTPRVSRQAPSLAPLQSVVEQAEHEDASMQKEDTYMNEASEEPISLASVAFDQGMRAYAQSDTEAHETEDSENTTETSASADQASKRSVYPTEVFEDNTIAEDERSGTQESSLSTSSESTASQDETEHHFVDEVLAELATDDEQAAPADSFFVESAAVEKRPLGAFSVAPVDTGGTDHEEPLLLEAHTEDDETEGDGYSGHHEVVITDDALIAPSHVDEQMVSTEVQEVAEMSVSPVTDLSSALAEELRDDIVAVESMKFESDVPAETVESIETHTAADGRSPAIVPHGGDIPRQYREAPQALSQEIAPIYDTNEYPQPIQHAPKKKSGWLVVIWILILMALGVVGAMVFYFYDPFNLL